MDTRQKQLAAWCSLVLSFCRLHKQSSMTVMEAQESPLFNNVKLQRKLPVESIQIVLEELRKKGNLEWLDKNKSSFLIMWRRPEEWGKLIYQWVSRSGQNNSVFTLYELTCGEDTEDEGNNAIFPTPTLMSSESSLQSLFDFQSFSSKFLSCMECRWFLFCFVFLPEHYLAVAYGGSGD
ncbi:vacuolar protein-sorting-associated protein 25 isoform X2 [Erinaceus europaeus]|nr:vacuolar protein-sorting-associated protein 25 isoform X2 [Erinaceus europaeus]